MAICSRSGIRSLRFPIFLIADQDGGVFQNRFHLLRIGDEVGRDEAAVELHAFDHFKHGLGGFRLLDGDNALIADLLHGIGHEFPDGGVVVGRDGGDLRLLLSLFHRARHRLERLDRNLARPIQPALEIDGACAGHDIFDSISQNGVRQHRSRACPIADSIACLLGGLTEHLCSKVLVGILEAELLGDRDPVIAHDRCAERLLDQNRLRFRSERYSYRVRQERSAMKNFFSRRRTKENLFMRHLSLSPNRFPIFYFGTAAETL